MRLCPALALAGLLALSLRASADTYNLSFISSTTEQMVGSGTLTFKGPSPPPDYTDQYTVVPLTDLSFDVYGQHFNFSDAGKTGSVVFYLGVISNYDLAADNGYAGLSADAFEYTFYSPDIQDAGTIESTLATSPSSTTPEPSTNALLASGLLGIAGIVHKRRNAWGDPAQRS